jgi:quercetin dioxygenase-like cupin family protein
MIVLVAGALVSTAAVGIAFGTPPAGVTPAAHVEAASLKKGTKVNADGIKFRTRRPAEVSVLTLTVDPGGTTGWHSHPGLAIISVTKGTGTLRFANCKAKSIPAGKAFVEAGTDRPTEFSNQTSSPVVLTVTFVAPRGAEIIRDEAASTCG